MTVVIPAEKTLLRGWHSLTYKESLKTAAAFFQMYFPFKCIFHGQSSRGDKSPLLAVPAALI